jgi:hypothetical protein
MDEKINLKELERKAYVLYHQDGLIDVFAGFSIISFGLMMLTSIPWLGAVFWFTGISLYAAAKRTFTVPRIGYVKFAQTKTKRMWTIAVITLSLSALLGTVAFIETSTAGSTPLWVILLIENLPLVIGAFGAATFSLLAYGFQINRLYAYSLLTPTLFILAHFVVSFSFPYSVILLGIFMVSYGSLLMYRFIRKYPLQATGSAGDTPNDRP